MRRISAAIALLTALAGACANAETPERSAGCGRPPPDAPPQSIDIGGVSRALIAFVPDRYDPERVYRLVLAFHGRTNPAARARRYYGLEAVDEDGTIFIYPQALWQEDGTFVWRLPEDLALFDRIVDRFAGRYCIAMDEIFAVGHSLGASFVNSLACARGDLLRGIATVAGGTSKVNCSGQTAALLLHNPEDRLVPISEGRAALEALLVQNDLTGEPTERYAAPFACERFGTRENRNPVIWCLYGQDDTQASRDYPHGWPEGAERAAMAFFAELE
jgi:polyhydroxybutyrate depolymerase